MDYEIKTLITREEIETRIKELAKVIENDYRGKELVVVGLLKGSVVFMTDLIKEINLPLMIDFMSVSSYAGRTTSGIVKISKDISVEVEGKHVLIVEDIIDTGFTLQNIKQLFAERNVASLKVCSLLDKPCRRRVEMKGEYIGFEIPDEFVVGYGLDYDQYLRNLPYVGVVINDKN